LDIRYYPQIKYAQIGQISLTMNLYIPKTRGDSVPVIIWLHGGGMIRRNYFSYGPPILCMLEFGYAIAQATYRVVSDDSYADPNLLLFPAQIRDVKTAVRFMRANAKKYHLDQERIGIAGDSAGGQLAALMALTPHIMEFEGDLSPGFSSEIKAACDFYGPTEFLTMDEQAKVGPIPAIIHNSANSPESLVCGGPIQEHRDRALQASPLTYARVYQGNAASLLIFHGDNDPNVPYQQSVMLYEVLKEKGADVTFYKVPGKDHSMSWFKEVQPKFLKFFEEHLK
jgi:acetyl esterase/lipase